MDGGHTDLIDPAIFNRNLAALREVDPAAADVFASLPIPDTVTACRGRDGTPTFRLRGEDGREHWFGGTSAPSVSAPALLSGFDAGNGNVLFFGVGHGTEALLLLRRLDPHRGVLVLEPNATAAAMALRLHDFARDIRDRRLVILPTASNATEGRLTEFLREHEGYCCPERLLLWPSQEPSAIPSLRAVAERAAATVGQDRGRAMAELHARWRQRPPAQLPPQPRVAVVALMAAPPVWDWAEQAITGARELGCQAEGFLVRNPQDCHVVRLANRLDAFQPDWVLAIRTARSVLNPAVPRGVPIVSWLDPIGPDAAGLAASLGPADAVAVTSAALGQRLAEAGVPANRLAVIPLPAPSIPETPLPEEDRTHDVVVVGDVVPPDPEDVGIQFNTQQVLWRESIAVIRREVESFTSDRAEAVLAAAERRVQMEIREREVRRAFISMIAETLGPTTVSLEVVQQMLAAGIRPYVLGSGWDRYAGVSTCHRGPMPTPSDARVILFRTRIYVCAGTAGFVGSDVFNAMASGAVILWRQHPRDDTEGGMGALFAEGTEYLAFRTTKQLLQSCHKLISDKQLRHGIRAEAMARLRGEHASVQRLGALRALVTRALAGR